MTKSIGSYINRNTQEEHEIFEKVDRVIKPSSSQVKVLPLKIYVTQFGDQVSKLDDDLSSFKLGKSIIYKIKKHATQPSGL